MNVWWRVNGVAAPFSCWTLPVYICFSLDSFWLNTARLLGWRGGGASGARQLHERRTAFMIGWEINWVGGGAAKIKLELGPSMADHSHSSHCVFVLTALAGGGALFNCIWALLVHSPADDTRGPQRETSTISGAAIVAARLARPRLTERESPRANRLIITELAIVTVVAYPWVEPGTTRFG